MNNVKMSTMYKYIDHRFITQLSRSGLIIIMILFSQSLIADDSLNEHELSEFHAIYAIQKFGIKVAETHYKLHHTETGYRFTQNTELHGLARMFADDSASAISLVDRIDGKLLLKKHTYRQTGREKNRDEDITLVWQTDDKNILTGKVSGVVRSKPIDHQINKPVWDILSFQIPLMIEANKKQKVYPYMALLKGEIDQYEFVLTSSEVLQFAGKDYQALHLVREDTVKNRQLHIWLLPELNNIPIVVENYRDNKIHSRAQLESVQFDQGKKHIDNITEDNDDI